MTTRAYRLVVTLLWCIVGIIHCTDLSGYRSCCQICHGNQELWMSTHPERTWRLEAEGEYVHNLVAPTAGFIEELQEVKAEVFGRTYTLRYSGLPVLVVETNISQSVLDQQYVQVDLTLVSDVAGVSVQEGQYEDVDNDLFDHTHTWLTSYAVSYSLDGQTYVWVQDGEDGQPRIFAGLSETLTYRMQDFGSVYTARYLRLHPLSARDYNGPTSSLLVRVGVVTCSQADYCVQPKYHCVLMSWQSWGECVCDWARCTRTRTRDTAHCPACGGDFCEDTVDTVECLPTQPVWQLALKILGIVVAVLLILVLISVCLYKKLKKEPEFVIQNQDKRDSLKKVKTERRLRSDLAVSGTIEEVEEIEKEEVNEFIEKDIVPKSKTPFKFNTNAEISNTVDSLSNRISGSRCRVPQSVEATGEMNRTVTVAEAATQPSLLPSVADNHPCLLEADGMTVMGIDGKPRKRKTKKRKARIGALGGTTHPSDDTLPTLTPSRGPFAATVANPLQRSIAPPEPTVVLATITDDRNRPIGGSGDQLPRPLHVLGADQRYNDQALSIDGDSSDPPPDYDDLYL